MKKIVTIALLLACFTMGAWAGQTNIDFSPSGNPTSGWVFTVSGDTDFGKGIVVEVHPVGDGGNYVRTACDYSSSGGAGSVFTCSVFTGGVPSAFQNKYMEFQFFFADYGTTNANESCFTTFSGGGCGTTAGDWTTVYVSGTTLPVSLASFTGAANEDKATLNWVTVSELNSDHFDVEHSANGGAWKKVGSVQAAGNSIDLRNYSYTVEGLQVGKHSFRLKSVDKNGDARYTASVQLNVEVPGQYVLYPAYPNPFNPATTITFAVASRQAVKAEVFNALGQKVRTLFNGTLEANVPHSAQFDASGLQSGMYIVRVTGASFKATQNVTLLK